jgi:hypothetical protein
MQYHCKQEGRKWWRFLYNAGTNRQELRLQRIILVNNAEKNAFVSTGAAQHPQRLLQFDEYQQKA